MSPQGRPTNHTYHSTASRHCGAPFGHDGATDPCDSAQGLRLADAEARAVAFIALLDGTYERHGTGP